ncbi:hypothetical protein [Aquincola tertiaricarbonis]|uniref:hypothetical protein n=1 Tax=Aquincola tertiaricarbonis TaxID=391953 RepID=UPI000614C9CD|nr:hypothetical protein [Aquincola tertiaricarbonis]
MAGSGTTLTARFTASTPTFCRATLLVSAKRSRSVWPSWACSTAATSNDSSWYAAWPAVPGVLRYSGCRLSVAKTSADGSSRSTRTCWLSAGVAKARVSGTKASPASLRTYSWNDSSAVDTPAGTTKSWYSTWAPGPSASLIAARVPCGGAATGLAVSGLPLPDWLRKPPSLPGRSATVQPSRPDSKPPLTSTACAGAPVAASAPHNAADPSRRWKAAGACMATLLQRRAMR